MLVMDINSICKTQLTDTYEESCYIYIYGFVDGDENYKKFFTDINNVCGGFVVRNSQKSKGGEGTQQENLFPFRILSEKMKMTIFNNFYEYVNFPKLYSNQ